MKTITKPIYVDAVHSLRPGSEFGLSGNTYDGLEWMDKSQPKPSKSELDSEYQRLVLIWEENDYQRKRAAEYPSITDYLDGIVKGDQEQVQAYIDACLAVKAKYPKPQGV